MLVRESVEFIGEEKNRVVGLQELPFVPLLASCRLLILVLFFLIPLGIAISLFNFYHVRIV